MLQVWRFTNGTTWEQLPDAPYEGRAYQAMFYHNKCIFVMGGQEVSFLGNPFYNDVWKSCDDGESWTSLGNAAWSTRAGIAFTIFQERMFVAGGCYGSSIGSGRKFLNDVWSSADGVSWRQETSNASWSPRSGARLVVHGEKILVIAGEIGFTPDTQLGDIFMSSDGAQWTLLTAAPAFSARSGHGVVVSNDLLLVVAGWHDNKCLHDLWTSTDGVAWSMRSNATWGCSASLARDPSASGWLSRCICLLLAAGCWLLAAGCWLLAAGCWLLAAGPPAARTKAVTIFARS
jgi:hypothetical protein